MAGEARRELPTGTVTFLFTDVERSTKTVAEVGDARYADLQEQHRKLLREAFTAHKGVEVGTEGDAFFVAFANASDAVAGATAGQRALDEHSVLRVRMGIHTGEALVREGDYIGHEVHRAKRVSDAGHGGQVLVSQTTAELVAGKTPLKDLGSYWLKDLAEPQQIHQVGTEDFPLLRAVQAFRNNIPTQRTSFVGREEECSLVRKRLSDHRITTLTGVGGCGKTRLAIKVAQDVLDDFPGGAWFVDLSRVTDPDALMGSVADALGLAGGIGVQVDLRAESIRVLSSDASLLVFDNCEHLIDACATLADELLASCPPLRILATSREALGVDGEQIYSIPSLDVPADGDETWGSVSVELFCDRAASVRPGFALTNENAAAVAEICRRLDGVPLAIELAAAQTSHLSPAQIAERLNDRFDLLTGGRRRVQRQQTLGATLDWSHDLLSDPERTLLRRLSVFPGTFALDAAEAVGGDDVGASTISTLRSLVAKSLVDTIEVDGAIRFRLLETVRLYAEEKLLGAGESESARTRHAGHFRGLVDGGVDALFESGALTKDKLDEAHNLRAAIAWSHKTRRADDLAVLVVGSFLLWAGSLDEGVRWTEAALALRDEITDINHTGSLLLVAAWLEGYRNRVDQVAAYVSDAIALAGPDATPPVWVTMARAMVCLVKAFLAAGGDEQARVEVTASVAMVKEAIATAPPVMAHTFCFLVAWTSALLGELEPAIEFSQLANTFTAEGVIIENNRATSDALLADLLHVVGRYDEALEVAERADAHRDVWRRLTGSTDLGWDIEYGRGKILALASVGRFTEAKRFAQELVAGTEHTTVPGSTPPLCSNLAVIAYRHGDVERAARLFGYALRSGEGSEPSSPIVRLYEPEVRKALGDEEFERLLADGGAMNQPEAIAYGIEGIDP